jgi:hypothetical protein
MCMPNLASACPDRRLAYRGYAVDRSGAEVRTQDISRNRNDQDDSEHLRVLVAIWLVERLTLQHLTAEHDEARLGVVRS